MKPNTRVSIEKIITRSWESTFKVSNAILKSVSKCGTSAHITFDRKTVKHNKSLSNGGHYYFSAFKIKPMHLTEEEILEMATDKLNISNPDSDKIHEIAKRLELEYDSETDKYFNPC